MKISAPKNIWVKVAAFILIPIVGAILMGGIWGIVDLLRSYGTGIATIPYFDHTNYQLEPFRRQTAGTFMGSVEDLINWHNLSFRGATRFGSGLGFIAGAFVGMGLFKYKQLIPRAAAGIIAGAAIGARSVLMLGSGVPLFLVGLITGATIGGLFMIYGAAPGKNSNLPTKGLRTTTTAP